MSGRFDAAPARSFWRRPAAAFALRIAALAALAFLAASTILPPLARADTGPDVPAAASPAATPSLAEMQVKLEAALKEQRFLAGQVEELKDQLSRRNQQIADLSAQLQAALRQGPVAATALAKPAGVTPLAAAAGALVTAQKKAAETSSAGLDARSGLATVLVAIVLFTLWGMVRSRRASQLSRRPGG